MASLVVNAVIVVLGAFALGIIVGYFVPGKKNKLRWYGVMLFFGFILSVLFALGAYVFTKHSFFFIASKTVGIITFGGSMLTFGILFFMFTAGLAIGDLHHTLTKAVPEEFKQASESLDKLKES